MKIQQTIAARLLAFMPFKHGLIMGTAIIIPASGAFAQEIASWPFAVDSGKPSASGAPVISAECTPKNEWPLTQNPKQIESPLVYKESIFESSSKYPLMVQFPSGKPESRGYLHSPEFNGLVGKKSWRIDMEVTLPSAAPVVLLAIGGTETGAVRMVKQFDGSVRLLQIGLFNVTVENVKMEPKLKHKLSLILDGKTLSLEVNGQIHPVSSAARPIAKEGISIGGPGDKSYQGLIGSISAIRIESPEVPK